MNIRNAKYNNHGGIDCEYEHPVHGWIPFTAHPDDIERLGKDVYASCVAGQHGTVAAATPPVVMVPQVVSPRQIRQALTRMNLRAQVEAAVAAGSQDLQDWWAYATEFDRTNSHVIDMGTALGVTERQLDDLWILAASL